MPQKLLLAVLLLIFLSSFCSPTKEKKKSFACPKAEADPCMTEILYQQCAEVEASCSGDVIITLSCPYREFGCQE